MWRTKGTLFQMGRASKSWSSVLQFFELWRPFGTLELMSRASYTEEVQEAQWQASDFMVCTRHEM